MIAVVAVLLALLLPAVQSAREAARCAACRGNLGQLALAMHGYESTWGCYPPAPIDWGIVVVPGTIIAGGQFSAQSALLPYLEQSPLHNSLNLGVPGANPGTTLDFGANHTAACTSIATFLCPSDSRPGSRAYAAVNYRASFGTCGSCNSEAADGAFSRSGVRPAEMTDGLSRTIGFSEKLVGSSARARFDGTRDWILHPGTESGAMTADDWVVEASRRTAKDAPYFRFDGGASWLHGALHLTGFTCALPPNTRMPDCAELHLSGMGVIAARSIHPGGVHVGFVDGSVHFSQSEINPAVWRALGTRSKGEIHPDEAF